MKKQKIKKRDDNAYLAIPGFLMIGIGIGLLINQVAALTLVGLGIGFLIAQFTKK